MNPKLSAEIQAEQDHGRQKYGSGPKDYDHDAQHGGWDWCAFIKDHTERAFQGTPREWRQHLVKVAGLAVSAIEAFDRKQKKSHDKK